MNGTNPSISAGDGICSLRRLRIRYTDISLSKRFLNMKGYFVLCAVALFATANCKYSSDMKEDEEKMPWVKAMSTIKSDGMFEIIATSQQGYPMDGEPTMNTVTLTTNILAADSSTVEVKAYFLHKAIMDCATFMPTADNMDDYTEIVFPEMSNATEDAAPANMKSMETDMNLFKLLEGQIVVVSGGVNYCGDIKITEYENINEITIMFTKGIEANREEMTKIFSEKLDTDNVWIGNIEMTEECSTAQIFINKKIDDYKMLAMARRMFSSMADFGVYSPSGMCKTDVRNSFIVDGLLMMIDEKLDKDEEPEEPEPPKQTCAGISAKLADEYKSRLAKYDCVVAEYSKKYGVSMDGCSGKDQQMGGDYGQQDGRGENMGCNCNYTASSEDEMYFVEIMKAWGASLDDPNIAKKKAELVKLVTGSSPNPSKISELTEKIKKLEMDLEEYYFKAHYGTCIVASYGDMALDKFKEIKELIPKVQDPYDILKGLLKESMTYMIEMMSEQMWEEPEDDYAAMEAIKSKLQIIFQITPGCSKESERKRVWEMLSNIEETLPPYIDGMAEIYGIENITMELNKLKELILADSENFAMKVFLGVYASKEVDVNDPIVMQFKTLLMTMKNYGKEINEAVKEWMKDADVNSLMTAHILMIPDAELEKGCSLKELAEKVMASQKEETDSERPTPCSQSTSSGQQGGMWGDQQWGDDQDRWERPQWQDRWDMDGYGGRYDDWRPGRGYGRPNRGQGYGRNQGGAGSYKDGY